ncbi:MAG TPA: STAS domain-containing protein [Solirubrobacteraceae bacterium]|nr:STAS domain-containing protein [Solirubrobacteraceae bacterium]
MPIPDKDRPDTWVSCQPGAYAPYDAPTLAGSPLLMDSSEFNVVVRREGAALVVAPEGELDMATVDSLRAALEGDLGDARSLVLDLRGLGFLDTSGLQLVFEQQRRAEQEGFSFVLVRGQRHVQRLFEIAGMNDRLTIVDEVKDVQDHG